MASRSLPRSAHDRRVALALAAIFLAGCTTQTPAPSPVGTAAGSGPRTPPGTSVAPTASGSATPAASVTFPLAVVTGMVNLQQSVTLAEVKAALAGGTLLLPCDVALPAGFTVPPSVRCTPADRIAAAVAGRPTTLALLPPGLVEPKAKVLPVDGADPFGSKEARTRPYPIVGSATKLPAAWTAYDASQIRTLVSVGESCPDRGVAQQAITLGKGWGWVFGGGTVKYVRIYPNPVGPGRVGDGFNIVDAVPTDNAGAVWNLIGAADFTIDDFECPVVRNWQVNTGLVFGIDPRVVGYLKRGGVDAVTLAANHDTDQGIPGLAETLDYFHRGGILTAGAGMDLNQALEPAVFDANGLKFALVGWNNVPGPIAAGPGQAGVAWTTEANVRESVRRARAAADVVICMPQWGFPEYREQMNPDELAAEKLFFDAGCDQILGHGPHWAGEVNLARSADGSTHVTVFGHGNFLFGQDWAQQSQEGILPELTFRGRQLVQVRLHPYFMLLQAQANLTDPQTDGRYVLQRVFAASRLAY